MVPSGVALSWTNRGATNRYNNDVLRITEGHDELVDVDGRWKLQFVARETGRPDSERPAQGSAVRGFDEARGGGGERRPVAGGVTFSGH